jgi:phosphoenolpyruvate synthase/pyruvate phosphate dikinase
MRIDPPAVLDQVGGKAYQLSRLARQWNVPRFFIVTFASESEIDDASVQSLLTGRCSELGFGVMAVRSSASLEDGDNASFAGVFESVLGVTVPGVIAAVRRVLESMEGERARSYCEAHGLRAGELKMAVVIQELIQSRVSGVCLTRVSELAGAPAIVIEACFGLGEALVSGHVAPDTYVLDRVTGATIRESIGYQKEALVTDATLGVRYAPIPFHRRKLRKLSREQLSEIAEQCLAIERELDLGAADIEWAYDREALHILQARRLVRLAS